MNTPFTHFYNLGRLGNAGDRVDFAADPEHLSAIAAWSGVQSLESLAVTVDIKKLGPTRFRLDYRLAAEVTQACVVTLEPVPAHMEHHFSRELHFVGNTRRNSESAGADTVLDAGTEEGPEDIESLHIDLAAPVLEEYSLALDPYPRRPGVEFSGIGEPIQARESPFAALKSLKKEG